MKIKKIYIKGFGPVDNQEYELGSGFNLFVGPNERGKSLTIDAVAKLLLPKFKHFPHINRIENHPAEFGSYLEVEANDELIKLQGKDLPANLSEISAQQWRDIFFIRDSDLTIGDDSLPEAHFYTKLTDKLTGLQSDKIDQLETTLRDLTQLTDKTNKFQSTSDNQDLGKRLAQANGLVQGDGELTVLIKQVQKNNWEELEQQLSLLEKELKDNKTLTDQLQLAKKRESFERAQKTIDQIKKLEQELLELESVNEKNYQKWRDSQRDGDRLEKEIAQLEDEKKQTTNNLKEAEQALNKQEAELESLKQFRAQLEGKISPAYEQLKVSMAQFKSHEQTLNTIRFALGISGGLTLILAVGLLLELNFSFLPILTIVFASLTILSIIWMIGQAFSKAKLDAHLETLKSDLSSIDLQADSLNQVGQALIEFQTRLGEEERELRVLSTNLSQEKARLNKIQEELPKKQSRLTGLSDEIGDIKRQTKAKDLGELEELLLDKKAKEKQLAQLEAVVKNNYAPQENEFLSSSSFGRPGLSKPDKIDYDQILKDLKKYQQVALEVKFNQSQLEEARLKIGKQEAELETLRQQLTDYQQQLQEIERQANQILPASEAFSCESTADLREIKTKLEQFVSSHQRKRRHTLWLIEKLEAVKQREKSKVADLFGPDSLASRYFSQATHAVYSQVKFDQETDQIKILRESDNRWLTPDKLSGGAFDQLYLSIRLSLGEKLLAKDKGFFIMDDPFIKADQRRLEQQLDLLLELSKQGWQIIYFSAKEEVRAALEEAINNNLVKYFDLFKIS